MDFASSFFLLAYLERAPANARVLVLERGKNDDKAWQMAQHRHGSVAAKDTIINRNPEKNWAFTIGFGGGSNCWWVCTPRFMPNDFRMRSAYGVGTDWPLSYEDLEPFYQHAEEIMSVSGAADGAPFPRSKPYPQPPQNFSEPDKYFKHR